MQEPGQTCSCHQMNPSSITRRICGPSMPLRPKRSRLRASAAKSFPVIFRTSSTSASIAGVRHPRCSAQGAHRDQAGWHVFRDEFVIERLRRTGGLIGSIAVVGEALAGLDERRLAYAVNAIEPIRQTRDGCTERRSEARRSALIASYSRATAGVTPSE